MSGGNGPGAGGDLHSVALSVPHPEQMMAALIASIPFASGDAPRIIDIGAGEGRLAAALLACFPRARLLALEESASRRSTAAIRLERFGVRVRVAPFTLATLDWWDLLAGADVAVSFLAVHHLNDAKKRYLYRAIADRLSTHGALAVADRIQPAHPASRRLAADAWDEAVRNQAAASGTPDGFTRFVESKGNAQRYPDSPNDPAALFHQLVWLKHAGFAGVDCCWAQAGHAVFCGYRSIDEPADGVGYPEAAAAARQALES